VPSINKTLPSLATGTSQNLEDEGEPNDLSRDVGTLEHAVMLAEPASMWEAELIYACAQAMRRVRRDCCPI
jgi:hypothetical protein